MSDITLAEKIAALEDAVLGACTEKDQDALRAVLDDLRMRDRALDEMPFLLHRLRSELPTVVQLINTNRSEARRAGAEEMRERAAQIAHAFIGSFIDHDRPYKMAGDIEDAILALPVE